MKLQQEKHELELEVQDAQWRVDQGQPPNVRMPRRVLCTFWKRTSPRLLAGGGGARVGAPCSRSNVQAKRGRAAGPATGRSHRCFRPGANHAHNGGATAKCVHSRRHWDTQALRYVLRCASLPCFANPDNLVRTGALAPFKPSASGRGLSHMRVPKPQPVEI